ncbi:hypothetical protein K493DRAFT_333232 [Basidiobolus meristosporus CBS 931.73]|uniref:RlpA-like protein double-psi beta-barrel domain-containing protein n=1 Tax=Basidiobolus meristosporus CBS 931.73 TaxID=1314790 RepID=A0A1Y1Z7V8_9FUNG|nr:hypothetical protein K493DRAFT_333232 [Basidiobolus meristosporus CBS 931.73]|eukprot:ORY06358.1 hypothetical protein K493DRAFT_333232 [Basidiobolus meristosporus CBS 931.73]
MISLKYFSTLAILFVASQVSAAPMKGEAGIHLSKRSGSFSGDGTYYTPGLGACGNVNTADQLIAAINAPQFGAYSHPSDSPACYSCAMVTGPLGSVKVKIVDKCPSCKFGSLDLSPAAFNHIALEAQGRVPISWTYVACDGSSEHEEKPAPAKTTPAAHTSTVKPTSTTKTPVPTTTHSVAPASTTTSTRAVVPTVASSNEFAASSACDFERKCISSGLQPEYLTCVNGEAITQSCASGTVCKNLLGDIICTWAD